MRGILFWVVIIRSRKSWYSFRWYKGSYGLLYHPHTRTSFEIIAIWILVAADESHTKGTRESFSKNLFKLTGFSCSTEESTSIPDWCQYRGWSVGGQTQHRIRIRWDSGASKLTAEAPKRKFPFVIFRNLWWRSLRGFLILDISATVQRISKK